MLHIEADGAHEVERIAAGDDAGADAVIENQAAAFEAILEMDIGGDGGELVGDAGKGKGRAW